MSPAGSGRTLATMAFGTVIFLAAVAAWLYGELHGLATDILWLVVVPIVSALFVSQPLANLADRTTQAGDAARQAASQTNGVLDERIRGAVSGAMSEALPGIVKAATSSALADRDAARTRQVRGDVSLDDTPPPARRRSASPTPPT